MGLLTLVPEHTINVGNTFIVFSLILVLAESYFWFVQNNFDIYSLIEFILAIVLLIYGLDLKSNKKKFISLNVLVDN